MFIRRIILAGLFLCFFIHFVHSDEISGGFSFTSPNFKKGTKWKVEGDRVNFLPNNLLEITPLRAFVTTKEGKVYRIYSDWALYDKQTQIVSSKANIEVIQGSTRLNGVGFIWDSRKNGIMFLKDVVVILGVDDSEGFFGGIL